MKNVFLSFAAVCSLAVCLASCGQELAVEDGGVRTYDVFSATIAEEPATKLAMESAGTLHWEAGDVISIFSDLEPDPVEFTMQEDGRFHGTPLTGSKFTAFYFAGKGKGSLLNVNPLSAFRNESGKALPMYAISTGAHLQFRQVCGVIHMHITGARSWDTAILESGNNEWLAGSGTIDLSENEPVLKLDGPGETSQNYHEEQGIGSDIYFPLPPMALSSGFTIRLLRNEAEEIRKSTTKDIQIQRGSMLTYTLDSDDPSLGPAQSGGVSAEERDALVAIYNAMDGPNWEYNENWCTGLDVDQWANVTVEGGHVAYLSFYFNHLKGTFPDEIKKLKWLKGLCLEETPGNITNPDIVFQLSGLESLDYGIGDLYSEDFQEYESWMVSLPPDIGNLKKLKSLAVYGIKGQLPEALFELAELQYLRLQHAWLNGPLPSGFGKLKNLEHLEIQGRWRDSWDHQLTGPIPDDLYDCTNLTFLDIADTQLSGEISPQIGKLTKLEHLRLANNEMSGPIPPELAVITPDPFDNNAIDLRGNHFSGKIPASFVNWEPWKLYWGYIVSNNELDMSGCMPSVPDFEVTTIDGGTYSSASVHNNEMTIFFQLATWCPFSPGIIPELKSVYSKYHDKGLQVVSFSYEDEDALLPYAQEYAIPWVCFSNGLAGNDNTLGTQMWPTNNFPGFAVYGSDGRLVFYSIGTTSLLTPFIEDHFGGGSAGYESTDFSSDGTVHVLQTATEGAGIDIILMGDAYSDRLIADGTYAADMNRAMEEFFAEEPYKSFRKRFNVSYVDVVSRNEVYNGATALETWYGDGTSVGGDNDKVLGYAGMALARTGGSVDEATVMVLMHRDYYAGTCYLFDTDQGDYGRGCSISYFPVSSAGDVFGQVLRHEAGGHGFGKLADEYSSSETITRDEINNHYKPMEPYGWWRNVDFTPDPAVVKWAQFIADERFSSENIGVYEGACTYAFGAYRPTENSIMNTNTGGFNAPSRYAIWYRIGKLSNGPEWNGTYEDFVAWDRSYRSSRTPVRRSAGRAAARPLPPLAPPVVIFKNIH